MTCGRRFSFVNLWANLALAVIKGAVGYMAGSRALVAASLYSINDVLSAIIVLVTLKVGRRPPDEDHPYGHGKAEFVAIGLMAVVLAVGVFFILFYSLIDIFRGVAGPPHMVALGVAALAMLTNGLLAKRGFCAARFFGSPALHTSAEHNRADAISSFAVVIGVSGATFLGIHVLDQIVAVFEALHILWLGGTLFGKSLRGLMDTSLPPSEIEDALDACREVEGVVRVLDLRTRLAGSYVWASVVVAVPTEYTVEQAEEVCNKVRTALRQRLGRSLEAHVGFRADDSAAADANERSAA